MKHTWLFFSFWILSAMGTGVLFAQQVNFGAFTDSPLTLTLLTPDELDFGDRVSGVGNVKIELTDNEAVPIRIEGVAYLDVTVTLQFPDGEYLLLEGDFDNLSDPQKSIPLSVSMAYYNRIQQPYPNEEVTEYEAKADATRVLGNTITFQIRQRPGGPPGPPPTPPHAGYEPPMAIAYLFLFGEIDVGNVNAGPYSGTVHVHVDYSTY